MKIILIIIIIFLYGCNDDTTAKKNCTDECNYIGDITCKGNDLKACIKNKNGCLEWNIIQECGDLECKDNECLDITNCDITEHKEENSCVPNSKLVKCQDAAPINAKSIEKNVTITWNSSKKKWNPPANCKWDCVLGYTKNENNICIKNNTKVVTCLSEGVIPENSHYNVIDVEVAWNEESSSWEKAPKCDWLCNDNLHRENNSCFENSKKVNCRSLNIENSIDQNRKVTINWDEENNTWEEVDSCEWNCKERFHKENNELKCFSDTKIVTCNHGDIPENSHYREVDVKIHWNNRDKNWSQIADCTWNCNQSYFKNNNSCMICIDEITSSNPNDSSDNGYLIEDNWIQGRSSWNKNYLTLYSNSCQYQSDWYKVILNYGEKFKAEISNNFNLNLYKDGHLKNTNNYYFNIDSNSFSFELLPISLIGLYDINIIGNNSNHIYEFETLKECAENFHYNDQANGCIPNNDIDCTYMDEITKNYNNSSFYQAYEIENLNEEFNTIINRYNGTCLNNANDWYKIKLKNQFIKIILSDINRNNLYLELYNEQKELLVKLNNETRNSLNLVIGSESEKYFYIRIYTADGMRYRLHTTKQYNPISHKDFIYSFITEELNFNNAKNRCQQLSAFNNGYLVTINSAEENSAIQLNLNNYEPWIGLYRDNINARLKWVGPNSNYRNIDHNSTVYNYLYMDLSGRWQYINRRSKRSFICEFDFK